MLIQKCIDMLGALGKTEVMMRDYAPEPEVSAVREELARLWNVAQQTGTHNVNALYEQIMTLDRQVQVMITRYVMPALKTQGRA